MRSGCAPGERIGQISQELERARPDKGHGRVTDDGSMTKTETLKKAGRSLRTAERYEELVGESMEVSNARRRPRALHALEQAH